MKQLKKFLNYSVRGYTYLYIRQKVVQEFESKITRYTLDFNFVHILVYTYHWHFFLRFLGHVLFSSADYPCSKSYLLKQMQILKVKIITIIKSYYILIFSALLWFILCTLYSPTCRQYYTEPKSRDAKPRD
jgi:hypothetical protein